MSDKIIVLVTGANTGLGYEIIKALYQSSTSYEIIVGARSTSKADDAVKKLQSEVGSSPSSLSTVVVDVQSDDSIAKATEELTQRHGKLDVLINNAGKASLVTTFLVCVQSL
jgi:NADP-dependent 3-hydroxy acid dehydrogenase YdfG